MEARLGVLGQRDFRVYWLGQAVSLVGTWMQQVAGAWVIVSLTSSKTSIAVVSFVGSLPVLGLSMHGGVLADRLDRRRVLIATQLAFAAISFVYAGLVASHAIRIPLIYLLSAATGVVIAYDLPAQQALIPDLVDARDIPQAVALNQAIFHGARLVGPALAGVLMAATSPAMAFVANGVSFFAVVYSLAVIRPAGQGGNPSSRGGGFVEGLRYVRAEPTVRALIGYAALTTMFVFPFLIVFVAIYVKTSAGGDAGALGLCMSASGAGAMLGALALLRIGEAWRGRLIVISCALAAALLGAISLARRPVPLALLILPLSFCVSVSIGLATTILQTTVPRELRGRVLGLYRMLWTGLVPAAGLLLGVLADGIGLRTTLRLMAAAYALTALPWLLQARLLSARSPGS